MSNNGTTHRTELPKLVDNGLDNNYGPVSQPPEIPLLIHPTSYQGLNDNGILTTVHIARNIIEHWNAINNAQPWMTGNNVALSRIVAAIPSHQLHLVQNAMYAKQAWENLWLVYQPHNSLRATTWLKDMQCLYNSLCDLDPEQMSDCDFVLAILDLMPQDNG
ncbi:hypothetical protein F5888DRAFT_1638455 [Russula emetica]|nr:hypothetical protein F5888DRAFT_1638455 [Russula emetica]